MGITMEELAQRMEALEKELGEAKNAAQRADDYRQVVNAMMRHIYGYYFHTEEEELRKYWAIDKEDVMYAHSEAAHYGFDSIYKYYVEGTNKTKADARAVGERVHGVKYEGNAAPGYRVVHILGSPYVEIAGDRKTAQGVWMSFSTMTRMNSEGQMEPQAVIQRFSGDFVNEDGAWKVWHVRDYEDFYLDIDKIISDRHKTARPEDKRSPYGPYSSKEELREAGIVNLELLSSYIYFPWSVTAQEPHLPEPYETWDDTVPNLRVLPDED